MSDKVEYRVVDTPGTGTQPLPFAVVETRLIAYFVDRGDAEAYAASIANGMPAAAVVPPALTRPKPHKPGPQERRRLREAAIARGETVKPVQTRVSGKRSLRRPTPPPERVATDDLEPKPPEAHEAAVDGAGSSGEVKTRQSDAADRHSSRPGTKLPDRGQERANADRDAAEAGGSPAPTAQSREAVPDAPRGNTAPAAEPPNKRVGADEVPPGPVLTRDECVDYLADHGDSRYYASSLELIRAVNRIREKKGLPTATTALVKEEPPRGVPLAETGAWEPIRPPTKAQLMGGR